MIASYDYEVPLKHNFCINTVKNPSETPSNSCFKFIYSKCKSKYFFGNYDDKGSSHQSDIIFFLCKHLRVAEIREHFQLSMIETTALAPTEMRRRVVDVL